MTLSTSANGDSVPAEIKLIPKNGQRVTCPHLGLPTDRETWLAFPSVGNYCHNATRSQSPHFDHQEAFCLSSNHVNCPVYNQPAGQKFPSELIGNTEAQSSKSRTVIGSILLVIVLIGAIAGGVWLVRGQLINNTTPQPTELPVVIVEATHTPTATDEPTATPTETPREPVPSTATPSNTPIPPTATPTLTSTPTSTMLPTDMPTSTPIPATATPTLPQIIVTVIQLNIRLGPGTAYPIVTTVVQDSRFDIIGQNNGRDWWQICCINGEPAWVFKGSVTVEGDVSDIPIAQDIPPTPFVSPTP